ncbi:dTDP-4-keto-6-deoxy-D-glucose epimerase [Solimonas sp. K1W22B-7]|uniref:dTDP-4-dehydrorhamnose 3,5-epimerase family protein n=1 Tax=Solimonas sp. K1W22B-7 TaxID=2303331 RepID=UPI000E32E69A|nr:dTDP-4-dehydrorhamnose 3,5-epimerase family protein [Solimonas sp. K1W22B-7]AXQ29907.1 dTDP-4-keto-6-deoxy-D-glucose epimerase [Solimonas sp. K1W22B-7]
MLFTELSLPGCYLLEPRVFQDARGRFVKTFMRSVLEAKGLRGDFCEQYYSTSAPGVIRGMHFQTPPHDHAKLVYCASGAVTDVLLDLRKGLESYGGHVSLSLSAESGHMVYIPSGVAHGFVATQAPALLVYNVTSEHAPNHDAGVRWDSFGFAWPVGEPVISDRDRAFQAFADYLSPFHS